MITSPIQWARQPVAKAATPKIDDGDVVAEVVILTTDVGNPVTRSTVLVLEVR